MVDPFRTLEDRLEGSSLYQPLVAAEESRKRTATGEMSSSVKAQLAKTLADRGIDTSGESAGQIYQRVHDLFEADFPTTVPKVQEAFGKTVDDVMRIKPAAIPSVYKTVEDVLGAGTVPIDADLKDALDAVGAYNELEERIKSGETLTDADLPAELSIERLAIRHIESLAEADEMLKEHLFNPDGTMTAYGEKLKEFRVDTLSKMEVAEILLGKSGQEYVIGKTKEMIAKKAEFNSYLTAAKPTLTAMTDRDLYDAYTNLELTYGQLSEKGLVETS